MADLKPCPFCGGEAEIYTPFHMMGDPSRAATYRGGVRCRTCGCESKATTPPEKAVTAWNRRAPEDRLAAQLRECADTLGADQIDEHRAMRAFADSMALLQEMPHISSIEAANVSLLEQK